MLSISILRLDRDRFQEEMVDVDSRLLSCTFYRLLFEELHFRLGVRAVIQQGSDDLYTAGQVLSVFHSPRRLLLTRET